MAATSASTIDAFLEALPDDRRAAMISLRKLILKKLPKGYVESFASGYVNYELPLSRYPTTYNKKPLVYMTLASQKSHLALYLVMVYQSPQLTAWLREAFATAGKKLDMGKSCVRFKSLDDLPLDVIGEVIASTPVEAFIKQYEQSREKP